ncbi:MAG: sensor histidine kinase [Nitrospirae bacterium]|nr:sensor histidine kinase [Nitrospirota bacterium]
MRSLQTRLSAGLIISLIVLFTLQWFIVSKTIRYLTEDYVASRLRHDAEGFLVALVTGSDNTPSYLNMQRIDPIYNRPFSGHYYQIQTGGQIIRSRSLWDEELVIPPASGDTITKSYSNGPRGQLLLLLAGNFIKQDQPVFIAVAEDLSPMEADMRRFQLRYALVSASILVFLILIQRLIVRAGLAPLEKVREDISSLERGEITQLREDVPGEMRPFINEINRLLDIMSRRLLRSRNAMGNLAHALKTPLTLLMQLPHQEEMNKCGEVRRQLIEQTERLNSLLERELKLARLSGVPRPGQQVVLGEELHHLFDALRKIYRDKPIKFEWSVPPHGVIAGDREDMLELIGNLLDNACKWARSTVSLAIASDAGLSITVEDDGPGCPDEEIERLSLRGVRLDESPAGYGLGLSIVKGIVEQYSGSIQFGRSEKLGGFRIDINLPVVY